MSISFLSVPPGTPASKGARLPADSLLIAELNIYMMASSNGNIFRVTGHLCGEFTGPRWIPAISAWINGWVNNREAGDLRRYRAHYDVIVMDH